MPPFLKLIPNLDMLAPPGLKASPELIASTESFIPALLPK
jgi:hypothetical protein